MFDLTITFDNGPEPEITPGALDALADHGVKSTFFVIGEKAVARPDLVRRAHDEGHWIGNHTWSHSTPLGQRTAAGEAVGEIERAQEAIGDLAHPSRLFRPFADGVMGPNLLNREAVKHLEAGGYSCVLWNVVGEEWLNPVGWVDAALAKCMSHAWALLVVHDLPTGAMLQLPRFLERAKAAGARFRQDFPPDCVPIDRGEVTGALSPYVAGGWPDRQMGRTVDV